MNGDADLRRRFEELRERERAAVPAFAVAPSRPSPRRWPALAAVALLLIVGAGAAIFSMRPRAVSFTAADRAAAQAMAAWHPPTEFLLRTPGREMLASTPSIPDRAARALIESSKGVSP